MGLPLKNVQLIIVTSVFMSLAIFAVGLRLVSRWMKRTKLTWNDYVIIAALIMLCGECGIVLNSKSTVPEGVQNTSIEASQVSREEKTYLASDILWVSTMATIKLSFLHLYLTIFKNKIFARCVYVVMAVNISWWIAMFIEELTICQPLAYTWDKSIEGHCGSTEKAYIAEAIINVILDGAVIILPMPMLWKLNMQLTKKVLIMGIFSLGTGVIAISICRIVALTKLNMNDISYTSFYTDLFSVLEPCLAVVNACLPVMHPIYTKCTSYELIPLLKNTLHSHSRKSNKYSSTSNNPSWNSASPTNNINGNDTNHFNRMYDAMYPVTNSDMTQMDTQLDTQVGAEEDHEDSNSEITRVGMEAGMPLSRIVSEDEKVQDQTMV